MARKKIVNIGNPSDDNESTDKSYVDTELF